MSVEQELRIMHACELGAVGVYRGHKCVARYVFRTNLSDFDDMRFHEKDHVSILKNLLKERHARLCVAHQLFFIGGLFYGVIIGLFGLKAIGTSTYAIEKIVDEEIELALLKLKNEQAICSQIRLIQLEEVQHQDSGRKLAGHRYFLSCAIERVAGIGAYTAKYLASSL